MKKIKKLLLAAALAMLGLFSSTQAQSTTLTFELTPILFNEAQSSGLRGDQYEPYVDFISALALGNANSNDQRSGPIAVLTTTGNVTFEMGSVTGSSNNWTQSLTQGAVSLSVTNNGAILNSPESYSNNSGLNTLFQSGMSTQRSGLDDGGLIEISLTGLTVGTSYRMQLLHYIPDVSPTTRQMILRNADDTSNNSGTYSYTIDANELFRASIMTVTFSAASPELVLELISDPNNAFNRAVLNGVVLHAIPEPAHYAAIFGGLTLACVCLRRRFCK
jgi:hypothetical protein